MILKKVFEMDIKTLQSSEETDWNKLLAEKLLSRLFDDRIELRKLSSELFCRVDPDFIINRLVQLLYHKFVYLSDLFNPKIIIY